MVDRSHRIFMSKEKATNAKNTILYKSTFQSSHNLPDVSTHPQFCFFFFLSIESCCLITTEMHEHECCGSVTYKLKS